VVASPYSEVTVTGTEPPPGAVTETVPVVGRPSDHTSLSVVADPVEAPKSARKVWGMPVDGIDRYGRSAICCEVAMVARAAGFT